MPTTPTLTFEDVVEIRYCLDAARRRLTELSDAVDLLIAVVGATPGLTPEPDNTPDPDLDEDPDDSEDTRDMDTAALAAAWPTEPVMRVTQGVWAGCVAARIDDDTYRFCAPDGDTWVLLRGIDPFPASWEPLRHAPTHLTYEDLRTLPDGAQITDRDAHVWTRVDDTWVEEDPLETREADDDELASDHYPLTLIHDPRTTQP